MATLFSSVYEKFLNQIDSTSLAKMVDVEVEILMYNYLNQTASTDFSTCLVDLTDVDLVLKQFNNTISDEIQWILAEGMVLHWIIGSQLNKEENLKNKLGTKDYNLHSPANLLKEIQAIEKTTRTNLTNKIRQYGWKYGEL